VSPFDAIFGPLRQLFDDLPSFRMVMAMCYQILLAALCGGVVGWQREQAGKAAGLRTHMLVCVGAALFVAGPKLAGMSDDAVSRIIQGITTGIGFVGAGAILKESEGRIVGLTTAAGVWMTSAIGVVVGLGLGSTAVMATVASLLILWLLPTGGSDAPDSRSPDDGKRV
jgi:putative Mg2+ transporter-C (MgtC) family protein